MDMEYVRLCLSDDTGLRSLVRCYQDVFATLPWAEWRKCAVCSAHWGIEQRAELAALGFTHCGRRVEEFWPATAVRSDLVHELSVPGASCWVALDAGRLVGFCHGYPVAVSALDDHLAIRGGSAAAVRRFGPIGQVAYQDDMGVIREYRGRGIASELYRLRLADFRALGLKASVVRTMTRPPTVTYQWYTAIGYEVIAEYGDEGGRVILARPIA
jgi:GNAT superfamily N-acetyltransferase